MYGRRVAAELLLLLSPKHRRAGTHVRSQRAASVQSPKDLAGSASDCPWAAARPLPHCHRLGLANRNERALQEAAQDICAIASEAAAAGSSVAAPAAPRFDTSAVAVIGGCDATDPDDMRRLAESTAVLIACLPNYRRARPAFLLR